jgi:sRNA-binding protein
MTTIAAPRRTDTENPNPRAVMGGNRPPLDVEARHAFDEALEEAKPGLRDRIDQLIAASDRATATDAESAGRCGELVKQIRAAAKVVDDAHTSAKAPYLAAGRAVDSAKTELRGPLDAAKVKVEAKQTQFLREEEAKRQAELRRQREEQEAAWRAEQDRLAAERAAAEPEAPAEVAPPPPPPAPEPERQIIRGDYGAAVSGQKVWMNQVEDYELAFIAVANNEKVREAIDKAISNMVRGGVREIPGVRIWSDVKASNR